MFQDFCPCILPRFLHRDEGGSPRNPQALSRATMCQKCDLLQHSNFRAFCLSEDLILETWRRETRPR